MPLIASGMSEGASMMLSSLMIGGVLCRWRFAWSYSGGVRRPTSSSRAAIAGSFGFALRIHVMRRWYLFAGLEQASGPELRCLRPRHKRLQRLVDARGPRLVL